MIIVNLLESKRALQPPCTHYLQQDAKREHVAYIAYSHDHVICTDDTRMNKRSDP